MSVSLSVPIDRIVQSIRNGDAGGSAWVDCDYPNMIPNRGYCVAVAGHEDIVDRNDCDDDALRALIAKKADYAKSINAKACVGWWGHDGKVYLDVSVWVADRNSAEVMGICNDQIAIWDIAAGKEISLK